MPSWTTCASKFPPTSSGLPSWSLWSGSAPASTPPLKVGFNKAFGYYISISRAKADQAPDDYIRKQTLTNEERYITPELKERGSSGLQLRVRNQHPGIRHLQPAAGAGGGPCGADPQSCRRRRRRRCALRSGGSGHLSGLLLPRDG